MTSKIPDELDLRVDDPQWMVINEVEGLIMRSFSAGLECAGESPFDVGATIILSDDHAVQQLNQQWRDQDKPTNILSFPAPQHEKTEAGRRYLGDMILAYGVVARQAVDQGKALETHLCHLVIHGALHLLGFDHQDDGKAHEMEELEKTAMAALKLPDPYLPETAIKEQIEI